MPFGRYDAVILVGAIQQTCLPTKEKYIVLIAVSNKQEGKFLKCGLRNLDICVALVGAAWWYSG